MKFLILEVIRIQSLEGDGADGGNADVVFDHEVGEASTVDEDDLLADGVGVIDGILDKMARRDEDAFIGLLSGEGSDETLDFLSTDVALPAFGLHIDYIESETIFVDHPIDAFVVRLLGDLGRFFAGAAVAHGEEQVDDDLFETVGIHCCQLL